MTVFKRIRNWDESPKAGLLAVAAGLVSAMIWVQIGGAGSHPGGAAGSSLHSATGVKFQAQLSQPMIVQGEDGTVYLDLSVITPSAPRRETLRQPSDVVVILDRSGSMGEGNKWQHAIAAVHSLLNRLEPIDRVGLVTFDTTARVDAGLTAATADNLARLRGIVAQLGPGASTNLGDALLAAERIASASPPQRRRRVLLLSDGMANQGIVEPAKLNAIAARIADRGSVVSTVGMGLGFNETLMASIADHGMGRFSYLEHLESLGSILTAELTDSRRIFAEGSEIRLELPEGMKLLDAAGYPIVHEGGAVVVRTGQLFWDQTKKLMATLRVPNHEITEYQLGPIRLDYRLGDRSFNQQLEPGRLQIACVAPERKPEAVASVDETIYRDAWARNNLGLLLKDVADKLRQGQRAAARQLLDSYKNDIEEADAMAPGVKSETEDRVKELEARVDEAFRGRDQKVKQNREAKAMYESSGRLQRQGKPKPKP